MKVGKAKNKFKKKKLPVMMGRYYDRLARTLGDSEGPGRFNKNFLTLPIPLKEGTRGGESRPKDRVKDRVTLWITLLSTGKKKYSS
jgi:hypothetical protein